MSKSKNKNKNTIIARDHQQFVIARRECEASPIGEAPKQSIEILRRLKAHQRIKAAFELHDFARSRIAAEIKRNNPNLTKGELLKQLNGRFVR